MKNKYTVYKNNVFILMNQKDGTVLETVINVADLYHVLTYPGKWYAHWNPHTKSYYVYGMLPKRKLTRLHSWIMGTNQIVDHINHDTLDNRRQNLRVVTNAENQQNRKGLASTNKSGVSGVYWYKSRQKWYAAFRKNKRRNFVGYFDTLDEAKYALDKAKEETNNGI